MAKRRKKKAAPLIHLSAGPLPPRLAERHADRRLIFSDASQLRHGGLAAVLFADADSEAEWDELMKRANRTTRIRRSVEVTLRNVAPDVAEMERNELTKMIEEAQAAEREAIEAELTRTMKKEDPFLPVLV